MGNSPSTTGLDRGGARGRRDIVKDGSRAEQRPVNYSTSSSESEEQEEDELFNRDKLVQESNRKSRVDDAAEPSFSYNHAVVVLADRTAACSAVRSAITATAEVLVIQRLQTFLSIFVTF